MSTNPPKPQIQPITKPVDVTEAGLPCDVDAERLVLGLVLLDEGRFSDIAGLKDGDFSLERHRRVFGAMRDLHEAGDAIDRITVVDRLKQRNEANPDDFSFLLDLDTGLPQLRHLDSWVRILHRMSFRRLAILEADKFRNECFLRTADPADLLARHLAQLETLNSNGTAARGKIRRVEDLRSIFADRLPTEYLVKPELPARAIIGLTGASESGKTTLACAWARDVHRQGHAVLILDRDKNPRDRVCDRLERLGIPSDGEHFHVWDCEQEAEAPQPDDPIAIDWVQRMVEATGKSPLVVADSLISFFKADEDENSAVDMRALFDRFRVLTGLGATVIAIHHPNRNGEARGSSDFKPASDQAFLVTNRDRDGGRLLDVITLKCEKSRYGLSDSIEYRYDAGRMQRSAKEECASQVGEMLMGLLKTNPGILTDEFVAMAVKTGRQKATRT